MSSNISVLNLIKYLWGHIGTHRRSQFGMLFILTAVTSLAEVISLGATLPFVTIVTQPEKIIKFPLLASFVELLGVKSNQDIVFMLAVAFGFAGLLAGMLRLTLLWLSIRLANSIGTDLSIEIYRRTLYQKYDVHISRSSSDVISGLTQKVNIATSVLISMVTVLTSLALLISIIVTLFVIDPTVSILSILIFGIAYSVVALITRRKLVRNSQYISESQTQVLKALQEGLGAIRDVLLDGSQKVYCEIYSNSNSKLYKANGDNAFINQAPRYAMEALAIVLVAIFILALSHQSDGITASLPLLAVLALGAQRLLPILQQIYGNWAVVNGSKVALMEVMRLLDQPLQIHSGGGEPIVFKESIRFNMVSFRYCENTPWVLDNISMTIKKGDRIGIVGSTGSGKSTILDMLMGLLEPTKGEIFIDQCLLGSGNLHSWQRTVAHVPQNIFLTDASFYENIAFGIPREKIDHIRVRKAAQQAKIAEFIESRSEGYGATVGERGVRLSGGQRQRVGIARALYKRASVLIFDEATSALDNQTEEAVMGEIEELSRDLTLIIVAHRLSTLKICDAVLDVNSGCFKMNKLIN